MKSTDRQIDNLVYQLPQGGCPLMKLESLKGMNSHAWADSCHSKSFCGDDNGR